MLSAVSRVFPATEIEAVAIDALYDSDAEVTANSAMTLSWHGSAAAEPHLWHRLQRWTDQWRNRSPGLFDDNEGHSAKDEEIRLGDALRRAITTAQAWLFDGSRRKRLYALCWTDDCRDQFKEPLAPPTVRTRVLRQMYGQPEFEVAWNQVGTLARLRSKVAQYPKGTVFGWCTDREGGGEIGKQPAVELREQAKSAVESQGYGFVKDPPAGSCQRIQFRTRRLVETRPTQTVRRWLCRGR